MRDNWSTIKITKFASLTSNPFRKLKFDQKVKPNPDKEPITLQLGDPSVFGNFPPPKELLEALKKSVDVDPFPYNPGHGRLEAREAVAEYSENRGAVTSEDIVLTSGCGHAMEMCILTLVEPGENVLIPRPCYSYRQLTDGMGIETRAYNLDSSNEWEVDLELMESLIDEKTRAIIVNTPGNPCGNVFSKEHVLKILEIAERYKVPIISDEIYEYMTFGAQFHPLASLSENVPILTCSGLSKRFLVPGIRMGWIIISDRHGALEEVRTGLLNLTGRILGPNSTVQISLPEILKNVPQKFFDETMITIARHAVITYKLLKKAPGLNPIMPKGSMYIMIKVELEKFPEFKTCLEFTEGLIREQSVLLFPGVPCFNFPGYVRIVLTVPEDLIITACGRIVEFCEEHYKA